MDWQLSVIDDWTQVDDDGNFIHRRVGLSVPRQSGKSFVVIALCCYLMLVHHMRIAFTAHNYSTVGDIFDRFKRIFGYRANDPNASDKELNQLVKNIRGATSRESVELIRMPDGLDPCVSFSTRTDSSLRGQSFDILVIDEAQELTAAQLSSILPVTNAGPAGNPMTIYIGTPETPASRGDVFRNVRSSAMTGADDICWLEWSVDEVGDVNDRARWYETNPSLGILSDESVLKAAAGSMLDFDFAQEYLGYWYAQSSDAVIDADAWEACETDNPPTEGITVLAAKFEPGGAVGTVCACIKPKEGKPYIEFIRSEPVAHGIAWMVELLEVEAPRTAQIVVDGGGYAQTLIDQLLAAGVNKRVIIKPRSADMCTACAQLLNAVNENAVTHYGQDELTRSATRTRRRSIGRDGWGFESTEDGDATLIEACALALWQSHITKRDPERRARIG